MKVYHPVMSLLEDLLVRRSLDPTELEGDEVKTAWRCRFCGYVHYGEKPPEECLHYIFPESAFKEVQRELSGKGSQSEGYNFYWL